MFRLRCNILSLETNGLNHAVRVWGGGDIYPEVYYLQLAHTCTRITSRLTELFAVKPATVHTSSIYTPQSADGFAVVHLAVSTILGSCGAIGFLSVSLEITHGFWESADWLEASGYKKNKKGNFTAHHMPQCPHPLISAPCPKGAITLYYTYPRFMTPLPSGSLLSNPC